MTVTTETITRELEEAVQDRLPEYGPLVAVTPQESSDGSYSNVVRYSLCFENRDLDVCLKIHRRRGMPFEQDCVGWADEEFRILKMLYASSQEGWSLSVVKPLLFLPRLPGILLETHPGEILNSVLKARRFRFGASRESMSELERCYFGLGESLQDMQRLSLERAEAREGIAALSPWVLNADDVLESADRGVIKTLSLCRAGRRQAAKKIYESTRRDFIALTTEDYPLVGAHGDFTPVNIFVSGSRVTMFDFVNFHLGHPFEDVSRFISYTYFLAKDPLSFCERDVSGLIGAFMEGYGLPDWRENAVLKFFFQKNIFRTLGGGLRFQNKSWLARSIYRWAMLRVFNRWIDSGMGLPGGRC